MATFKDEISSTPNANYLFIRYVFKDNGCDA